MDKKIKNIKVSVSTVLLSFFIISYFDNSYRFLIEINKYYCLFVFDIIIKFKGIAKYPTYQENISCMN